MLKRIAAAKNKKGFTLVELIVVIAILSICSGMLVGIIAMSVTKYSESTDTEYCKQEATYIDKYYTKWSGTAFEIKDISDDYNSGSFTYSDSYYYMILDPTDDTIDFRIGMEGNTYESMIKCDFVKSFEHKTVYLDDDAINDGDARLSQYTIVMCNDKGTANEYQYTGSVVLNNDTVDIIDSSYDLSTLTEPVCISFKMK